MRAALSLIAALAILLWIAAPVPDCAGKSETQCERLAMINAGAID
jgi:hypothetical protein